MAMQNHENADIFRQYALGDTDSTCTCLDHEVH